MLRALLLALPCAFLFTSCLQLDPDVVEESPTDTEPEWFFLTRSDGLAEDTVTTMTKDSEGYYWFGHLTSGITRWDGDKEFTYITNLQGLSDNYVYRIVEAPDGRIWVATNRGYDIIEGTTVITSEFYNYEFTDIVFPEPGSVWLSSRLGIFVFSEAGDSLILDNVCTLCRNTRKLLVDSDKNIWAGSLQDLRKYNKAKGYQVDKRYFLTPSENYFFVYVSEIFEDENKNIYGGTFYGTSNTFLVDGSEPQFFDFSVVNPTPVGAIATYDNQLWVGTQGSGVILKSGTSLIQLFNELPSPIVLDFLNDGESIWIATFSGVAKYTVR